ncbi:MAG: hypothetical protein II344_02715 [Bacteroidales bacterium]|nr:hypothetical protein [Bacteroidales bacterium]
MRNNVMSRGISLSVVLVISFFLYSCGVNYKVKQIDKENITAKVLVGESSSTKQSLDNLNEAGLADTLSHKGVLESRSIYMEAEYDSLMGETIAKDVLNEIVVEASFKNVAERNGLVHISFDVFVPEKLQDLHWQLRLSPKLYYLDEEMNLDNIFITGVKFRKLQNKGYSRYNRYVGMVVDDSLYNEKFIYWGLLDKFILRHSDMADMAQLHYKKKLLIKLNEKLSENKDQIFERFVKEPFVKERVRLDSVISDSQTQVIKYSYSQQIKARNNLRKVEMAMEGEIYKDGEKLCTLEPSDTLTYYVSSMVSFVEDSPRYATKVVNRNLYLDENYSLDFKKGTWEIDELFSHNWVEIGNMKKRIREVLQDTTYVVDSLIISSACSPEGSVTLNTRLSGRRGNSIKELIDKYVKFYKDSILKEFWNINLLEAEDVDTNGKIEIKLANKSEDWNGLYNLIYTSEVLDNKEKILEIFSIGNLDLRENALRKLPEYKYIKDTIYPKLRKVNLKFALHRKGMLKDTVHTVVLDSVYMAGVRALKERDYKTAISYLKDYNCLNAAIAYISMDYNNSAYKVLQNLPESADRDYLFAVVCSRLGDEKRAVEYYMNSVELEPSMRHRGNLDPEISLLITKYNLFTNY